MDHEEVLLSVLAYLLKIMKSGKDYSKFKIEFDHIRHGNYDAFNDTVGIGIMTPLVVMAPQELLDKDLRHEHYGHYLGILTSAPAIADLGNRCYNEFGLFQDQDISMETYRKVAFFEIVIRVHSDLEKLTADRDNLNNIIDALFKSKRAKPEDISLMHKGREFLNDIKHVNNPYKPKYKRKFADWKSGIIQFNLAYELLEKYDLKLRY